MRRACGLEHVPTDLPWPVATLGTFDGVHLGHQEILRDTIRWARERSGTALVVTFRQPPRAVTVGAPAPCITSLEHRLVLFEQIGIDVAAVLDFTTELAAMPAEAFAQEVLCGALAVRGVQWGFNGRFGRNAEGDIDLLRRLERQGRFAVRQSRAVELDGVVISSTGIRKAILEGRLEEASRMLGRPVSLLGTVVAGEGRGASLGFPTANLDPHHEAVPPPGIYACRVLVRGRRHLAVANIGSCPTFSPPKPPDSVEVHILDYRDSIRGEDIEVQFGRFLRAEQTFRCVEELIEQMRRDVAQVRQTAVDG